MVDIIRAVKKFHVERQPGGNVGGKSRNKSSMTNSAEFDSEEGGGGVKTGAGTATAGGPGHVAAHEKDLSLAEVLIERRKNKVVIVQDSSAGELHCAGAAGVG